MSEVPRMMDPSQHPFKVEREYIRALNAVKLERTFAKPFIGALDGHRDTVQCLTKHPTSVNIILSGSSDGEVIYNIYIYILFLYIYIYIYKYIYCLYNCSSDGEVIFGCYCFLCRARV